METQVRSIKTDMNRLIIMSAIFLAIAAPCILYVKGITAIIFIVLYCIGMAFSAIGLLSHIFDAKGAAMAIGIYTDQTGQRKASVERYKEFIEIYEKKSSSLIYWLSYAIALTWLAVFLAAGINILAYMIIGLAFVSEISQYRVYKAIKNNITTWGAAMYINEVRNFFGKKEESDK